VKKKDEKEEKKGKKEEDAEEKTYKIVDADVADQLPDESSSPSEVQVHKKFNYMKDWETANVQTASGSKIVSKIVHLNSGGSEGSRIGSWNVFYSKKIEEEEEKEKEKKKRHTSLPHSPNSSSPSLISILRAEHEKKVKEEEEQQNKQKNRKTWLFKSFIKAMHW